MCLCVLPVKLIIAGESTGVCVCERVRECVCLRASVSKYAVKSTLAGEFTGVGVTERECACACVRVCVSMCICAHRT